MRRKLKNLKNLNSHAAINLATKKNTCSEEQAICPHKFSSATAHNYAQCCRNMNLLLPPRRVHPVLILSIWCKFTRWPNPVK